MLHQYSVPIFLMLKLTTSKMLLKLKVENFKCMTSTTKCGVLYL